MFFHQLKQAIQVDSLTSVSTYKDSELRIPYTDYSDFVHKAGSFSLMTDEKVECLVAKESFQLRLTPRLSFFFSFFSIIQQRSVPRTAYYGVVTFRFQSNTVFLYPSEILNFDYKTKTYDYHATPLTASELQRIFY
jgi:hypothetical protein